MVGDLRQGRGLVDEQVDAQAAQVVGPVQVGRVSRQVVSREHQGDGIRHVGAPHRPLHFGADAHVDLGGIEYRLAEAGADRRGVAAVCTLVEQQRRPGVVLAVLPRAAKDIEPVRVVVARCPQVALHDAHPLDIQQVVSQRQVVRVALAAIVAHLLRQGGLAGCDTSRTVIQAVGRHRIAAIPGPLRVVRAGSQPAVCVAQTLPAIQDGGDRLQVLRIGIHQPGIHPGADHRRSGP